MRIQKRVLVGAVALMAAFSLVACGSGNSSAPASSQVPSSSQQEAGEKTEGLVTAVEDTGFTIRTQDEEELIFTADEELAAQVAEDTWVKVEYTGEGESRAAQAVEDVSSITYEGIVKDAAMNTLVLETETGDELNFTTTIAEKDLADGLVLGMNVAVTCPFGYEPTEEQAGLAIQISQLESGSSSQASAETGSQPDSQESASSESGSPADESASQPDSTPAA